jgi:hypothetical protein
MATATPIPRLVAGQQTWFGRAIAWLKGEVTGGLATLTDFLKHEAFPFIENFLKQTALDEIHALTPLAMEAAKEVVTDINKLFENPGQFMADVSAIGRSTLQKAEAAGLQVAETSVVTASQAALHNLIAAAPKT